MSKCPLGAATHVVAFCIVRGNLDFCLEDRLKFAVQFEFKPLKKVLFPIHAMKAYGGQRRYSSSHC